MGLCMRLRFAATIITTTLVCAACASNEVAAIKGRFPLQSEYELVTDAATAHCAETALHHYQGAEAAPYSEQVQIDCLGYRFAGAPRKLEFLVNEGSLGFYWILLEPGDLPSVRRAFVARFGEPTCTNELYMIFSEEGTALRSEPAEVLVALPAELNAITGGCA